MKHLYTLFLVTLFSVALHAQTPFCDPQGNVMIFSNYDGGTLNIDVDQNIPNLKIGIVSYEPVHINISGLYAGNVTEVRFAGYMPSGNNHCGLGNSAVTTISGVPAPVDTIIYLPAATYSNPNGYSMIICNASCNTTQNQGGCNTADQIAHYFLTNFGGSLYFHKTQYGCWQGTQAISAGGNCCANPLMAIENESAVPFAMSPNPANDMVAFTFPATCDVQFIEIVNLLGEVVACTQVVAGTTALQISVAELAPGTYIVKSTGTSETHSEKLIITE